MGSRSGRIYHAADEHSPSAGSGRRQNKYSLQSASGLDLLNGGKERLQLYTCNIELASNRLAYPAEMEVG